MPRRNAPYPLQFRQQMIELVLAGQLTLAEGEAVHLLDVGDCLELGPPAQCRFRNQTNEPCRYLVAAGRRD